MTVFSDAATYGSLFFLAMILPALVADPAVADRFNKDTVLVAVVGAVGVGAALTLVGNAAWSRFGYEKEPFRSRVAGLFPKQEEAAGSIAPDEHLRAFLATAYAFQSGAGDALLDWVHRRHERFASHLIGAVTIVAGLLVSDLISLLWSPQRIVVMALLAVLAVSAVWFGARQREHAELMEELWLTLHRGRS